MKKPDNTRKPVAKSLHTVTVLYQVARMEADTGASAPFPSLAAMVAALDRAMTVLELDGRPDPYALRARALGLLCAEQPKEA